MFAYLGKYGNHHIVIPIFVHAGGHMTVTLFVVEHDNIVNIVLCLGAVHYQCSSLNTWLELACFNTHSSPALLILVLSQPRSMEWGEKSAN